MDESPQAVAATTFRIVKKGYDPDEVRTYLGEVARSLTAAQEHAASMEQRARQAVEKAKEVIHQRQATPAGGLKPEDSETISRTLLLAQRTADNTMADARSEAEKVRAAARAEADTSVSAAKVEAGRLIEAAKADARRAGESERVRVEEELQSLLARLEFLKDDVVQLERFADDQRNRLREAAEALLDIAERPVGGLAGQRPPVLSAASDAPPPLAEPSGGIDHGASMDASDDGWVEETGLSFADDRQDVEEGASDEAKDARGADPDAPTQALRIVPAADVDDRDNLGLFDDHPITDEVPIVPPPPPPPPGGMRIVDDEESR